MKPFIFFTLLISFVTGCDNSDNPVGKMPPVLTLNETAPDFKFHSILNSEEPLQSLSDYKGKVIYLDFWASWCKPCIQSMPLLNKLRNEFKEDGFEIIAVNLDVVAEKGLNFLNNHPVDYPVVIAINHRISDVFEIRGLPTSYIIDRQGILRYVHQGFKEQDILIIKDQLLEILNKKIKDKKK